MTRLSLFLTGTLLLPTLADAACPGDISDCYKQILRQYQEEDPDSDIGKRTAVLLKEWPRRPDTTDTTALADWNQKVEAYRRKVNSENPEEWEFIDSVTRTSYPRERFAVEADRIQKEEKERREAEERAGKPAPEDKPVDVPGKKPPVGTGADPMNGGGGNGPGNQPGGAVTREQLPVGMQNRLGNAEVTLESKPQDPGANSDVGQIYYYMGDHEGAFRRLGTAIDNGSQDAMDYALYGRSAYALGDFELAYRAGQQALALDPKNENAKALVLLSKGRVSSRSLSGSGGARDLGASFNSSANAAAAAAQMAADLPAGPGGGANAAAIAAAAVRQMNQPPTKIQQSAGLTREVVAALSVQDYSAAYNVATQAIELNPKNAQAWNLRAITNNRLTRYNDAEYDASFALGLVPGNAAALQTRSWAFAKQKKYKESLADANFTIEKEPDNSFAYFNRAHALAGVGDKQAALESLRRSAELDPRFKPVYEEALKAPEDSDLLFLFNAEPGGKTAAAPLPPGAKKKRAFRLIFLSLSGGVLVALGLLHVFSATWREKVRATMRRVLASSPEIGSQRGSAASGTASGVPMPENTGKGFWGGYELTREIGSGGMGIVYEAQDRTLDRKVAIKKMRDEIRADPMERQRFVLEARTVAALHHPNIVEIYAIVEDESDVYLVFEYIPGQTVSDLLREKGPLPFAQAKEILRGTCDAVSHAHAHKVIHRDIKPSNVMIAPEGQAKVMDFGVARQAKDAMTKMSMTNTIVGTPPYMAPEQEQGTVRRESDVFALGVLFYEMLCNELPFSGVGAGMLLNKINGRHTTLSHKARQRLPAGLDEVVARALHPDPDKRFSTPKEFFAAVDALAGAPANG